MQNLRKYFFNLGIAATLFYSASSPAADLDSLSQKVDSLSATSQKNNEEVAKAMNLMTQIQQQFQSIRGEVEASKYLTKESDKTYEDLSLRVTTLEDKIEQIRQMMQEMVKNNSGGASAAASNPSPVASPNATTNAAPSSNAAPGEREEFQAQLQKVNSQDFAGAITGFNAFLQKYPQSESAGSAQFWIAESQFSLGDFAKAIQAYQVFVEKYPSHSRVREAIYQQGQGFARLKKHEEAKLFFQKVVSTYPNTAEAAKAQARLHQIEELGNRGELPVAAAAVESSDPTPVKANVSVTPSPKSTAAPKTTAPKSASPNAKNRPPLPVNR